jgi:hypothetical protein
MLTADPGQYLTRHCDLADTRATEELVSDRLQADIDFVVARLIGDPAVTV